MAISLPSRFTTYAAVVLLLTAPGYGGMKKYDGQLRRAVALQEPQFEVRALASALNANATLLPVCIVAFFDEIRHSLEASPAFSKIEPILSTGHENRRIAGPVRAGLVILLPASALSLHFRWFAAALRATSGTETVLFTGATIFVLLSMFGLHWRAYVLLRYRVHALSESMVRFVTSGFRIWPESSREYLLPRLPNSIRWILEPASVIAPLTVNAELMASAIQDSKQRMSQQQERNLVWLSFLCHDLGAPLRRVRFRLKALECDEHLGPEERRKILESAHVEIAQMDELIASVSDFTQLERDVEREFEPSALDEILEAALTVFEFDAGRLNIELDLRVSPEIGELPMKKLLIRQAMENLISNALRFTPEGGLVSVCAERCGDMAHIRVSDTGIGIPPAEIEHVFDYRFRGENQPGPTRLESLGLGLALVRKVAELHEGEVTVRNLEPQGAEFILALPLSRPAPSFR